LVEVSGAIPSGTQDWFFEADVLATGAAAQKSFARVLTNAANAVDYNTSSIDMTGDFDLRFYVALADSGDSIVLQHIEAEFIG
jgi:hypothetical protein